MAHDATADECRKGAQPATHTWSHRRKGLHYDTRQTHGCPTLPSTYCKNDSASYRPTAQGRGVRYSCHTWGERPYRRNSWDWPGIENYRSTPGSQKQPDGQMAAHSSDCCRIQTNGSCSWRQQRRGTYGRWNAGGLCLPRTNSHEH